MGHSERLIAFLYNAFALFSEAFLSSSISVREGRIIWKAKAIRKYLKSCHLYLNFWSIHVKFYAGFDPTESSNISKIRFKG